MNDWQLTTVTEINTAIDSAPDMDAIEAVAMEVAMSTQDWVKVGCWPAIARRHKEMCEGDSPPILVVVDAMNWIRADFSVTSIMADCVENFMRRLRHINRQVRAKWIVVATDSRDGLWRKDMCEQYKQSRDERPSDVDAICRAVGVACEHMQVPMISVPGEEADDIAATMVTRCLCRGGRGVVCTSDKDYYQLVCQDVAAWSKDKYHKPDDVVEKIGVTPKQIVDYLCITGKDDVPSAKGIGPKTAVELLRKHGDFIGIYDRRESLTPGKREAIEEFAPTYWMARTLHTLKRNVKIDFDWGSTHCLG